jgi:hypothetical protein
MFIAVTMICLLLGLAMAWLRSQSAELQRHQKIAKKLQELNATVRWQNQTPQWIRDRTGEIAALDRISFIRFDFKTDIPVAVEQLQKLGKFQGISVKKQVLTNDAVYRIAQLDKSIRIYLLPAHDYIGGPTARQHLNDVAEVQRALPMFKVDGGP